ncbi:MAG: DUF1569 domain-containing protein [Acidobacteriaceae bacterium]
MFVQSVPALPLHPELSVLQEEIKATLYGLDDRMTQMHPRKRPESWSIQQILQHLMLTYELSSRAFADRIAKGSPTARSITLKEKLIQKTVLDWGYLPNGRKAPEAVLPQKLTLPPMSGEQLAQETDRRLREMDQFGTLVESKFGPGRCVSHMILGPMSVSQWRTFHVVHGRLHLKQVARLRGEMHLDIMNLSKKH